MFPPPLRCIRRFFCPMGREFLFCFVGRGLPDAPLQWFSAGSFAACGRRESSALRGGLLSQRWESNQRIAGGRRRGELRSPMTAYPRSPVTGVTPWGGQNISGAQNLSGVPRFLPGHWALGLQKLGPGAVPQRRLGFLSQRSRCVFTVGATLAVARSLPL